MRITNIDDFNDLTEPQKQALERLLPDSDARIIKRLKSSKSVSLPIGSDSFNMIAFIDHDLGPAFWGIVKMITTSKDFKYADRHDEDEVEKGRKVFEHFQALKNVNAGTFEIPTDMGSSCDDGREVCAILYQLAGDDHKKTATLSELFLGDDGDYEQARACLKILSQTLLGNPAWYNIPGDFRDYTSSSIPQLLQNTINWEGKDRINGTAVDGTRIASIEERILTKDDSSSEISGWLFETREEILFPRILFGGRNLHPNPIAYSYNPAYWGEIHDIDHWPKGFCHGDLHSRNIIWDPQKGKVYIIDWETLSERQLVFFDHAYLILDIWLKMCVDEIDRTVPRLRRREWIRWKDLIKKATIHPDIGIHGQSREAWELTQPIFKAKESIIEKMMDAGYGPETDLNNSFSVAAIAVAMNFIRKKGLNALQQCFILYFGSLFLETILDSRKVNRGETGQNRPASLNQKPFIKQETLPFVPPDGKVSCLPTVELIKKRYCLLGRERELNKIREQLMSNEGRTLAIIGERRSGKTSILKTAAQEMEGLYTFKWIDITDVQSWEAFVARVLAIVVPNNNRDASQMSLSALKMLCESHLRLNHVLCFDELDVLFSGAEDKTLYKNGMGFIRWLRDSTDASLFVTMTGITDRTREWHPMKEGNEFYPSLIHVGNLLPFLSRIDIEHGFERYFQGLLAESDIAELTDYLYDCTWGQPFFVQTTFIEFYSKLKAGDEATTTISTLKAAMVDALEKEYPMTESLKGVLSEHFTSVEKYCFWLWAQMDRVIKYTDLRSPLEKRTARQLERRLYLRETDGGYLLLPCWGIWLRSQSAWDFPIPPELDHLSVKQDDRLYIYDTNPTVQGYINEQEVDFGKAGWLLRTLCQNNHEDLVSFKEIIAIRWGNDISGVGHERELYGDFDEIQSVLKGAGVDPDAYIRVVQREFFKLTERVVCSVK